VTQLSVPASPAIVIAYATAVPELLGRVTTKLTPLQNKMKSTKRHRHVGNCKLKSIGAQNQIPFRRLTLGSNPLHLIANARSVFKSTIYDAHRRATCEKSCNVNCLVTRSSPWVPASQNDSTKRRNTYGTMSMACDTRVTPEEKRRFLAQRAQETEQRRALFNAETDAETT